MLRSPFEPFLREARAVVLDGGFATELEAAGKDISVRHTHLLCQLRWLMVTAGGRCFLEELLTILLVQPALFMLVPALYLVSS
jgi:hypothetical protein